ncbi:MAG: hypothetical protein FWE67_06595 [Planctomycetaceae bacterium]|nr:hypothetical protein [Planctomycetaceae bacterium]
MKQILFFLSLSALLFSTSVNADDPLKAGVAREIITPKLGGLFMGYSSDKPSTSVHDDLTVTALALEQGQTKVVLMSVTVCLLGNELCAKLRTVCGEAVGVPAANVIIAVSHTHSGPVTSDSGDAAYSDRDNDYCTEILFPKCIAAAKASVKDMKPVTVGTAATETRAGVNRRQLLPDNRVILGQNPWGPYDSTMTVISFKSADGKPLANILHCTAHCTGAGSNTEVSRDWSGVPTDRLEKESGAPTLFFNGLFGDVGPRLSNGRSTGNIELAMEVGEIAAADASRAYKSIGAYQNETLAVVTGEVRLPHAPIKALEVAQKELAELEAAKPGRWSARNINILKKIVEAHAKGETGDSYFTYGQTLVKVGPIVFIPVPFETSCEMSLRLRTYSKFGHTLPLGCTNGYNSYFPTQEQICRGGYEIERLTWAAPRRLADNADWHLINQNLQLMEKF